MTIFEELKARGLIFQTTDEEALVKAFEEGPVSYYTCKDSDKVSKVETVCCWVITSVV